MQRIEIKHNFYWNEIDFLVSLVADFQCYTLVKLDSSDLYQNTSYSQKKSKVNTNRDKFSHSLSKEYSFPKVFSKEYFQNNLKGLFSKHTKVFFKNSLIIS